MREASLVGMRRLALIILATGAAGSLGFLLYAARNSPQLLMMIIGSWVLAPFGGLVVADMFSKRWSALSRKALYRLMLAVALSSLAAYGGDLQWPRTPRAAMFVLVPGLSWLAIAAALSVTWLRTRGRTIQ